MAQTITQELQELAQLQHKKPEKIIAEAVEIGLHKLWVDTVLGRYLNKEISRRKAVELVGLERVRLAEEQDKAVQGDVRWGMNNAGRN